MEIKEIKKKTEKELHQLLMEFRDKLRELRFKDANKQLKNVREIRIVRTTISRVLTILNQKKTEVQPEEKIEKESEVK
ncbi:MAG: 50S ribosomal protein L29 [Candidatus Falkowbacteria bacterium GW2011_GWC2_38_22]|uniref:Large ribosomal subunit protein uL29 n=1 Tax=Candidatus Falkowbacteria bacterium GW2011_GWE1_38_31 TaxID=1618638 RepID=A0A0G0MYQ4_9BACT|nr:MAG: 50S ribosomal protein L29 [Candidatus Falkowbacteria bacterium GW2011_GWF2_38_1205]KKQ61184.1 MAG: 50S ribosomal protein L29 [Candidatus Falkowbacteria bacterium GW2011_GWC2_38_22]KKQ63309.1 MAG: 50S ribosomal protein L29 [Candidatus Falkowbacteria bacterium GW2011_GWF1_38_22]KKQ65573.1 MAG: 50S ribosomal protein L29 [Candidatus Falkowbacteria bacterium GW2011_GWE2_38_254]KKQ70041.1 MAG: 50S ribosomal protein L29 [Candidatus Falkowbacteria bacterium GW2011_GWE1_38_31]KKQ72718.1 MAG: 50